MTLTIAPPSPIDGTTPTMGMDASSRGDGKGGDRIVFLNGEFVPEADAKVSVFDRGFLMGDGVYEVVPIVEGVLLDERPFLERLRRSLGELDLPWPRSCPTESALVKMLQTLGEKNRVTEGIVYMQVTRGVPRFTAENPRRQFPFPDPGMLTPTLMAFAETKPILHNPRTATGARIITVPEIRWKRRDIKSIALLAQCVSRELAIRQGVFEGWMVEEDGTITEGTSSSAFIVKDGVLVTRPLNHEILPGIRRKSLLQLTEAGGMNVTIQERKFTVQEAYDADEAFSSSASTLVVPIVEIDGKTIGDGKPGPVAIRLRELYVEAAMETIRRKKMEKKERAERDDHI